MLELGMSWELALEAAAWSGTRDDLRALAHRIAMIRSEQKSPIANRQSQNG
jgi:hypothetical protein